MEDEGHQRHQALPPFSRSNALEWRNGVYQDAKIMCNDIDPNGLLFLVVKDEEEFRIHAEIFPVEGFPEWKERNFIPPAGDALQGNSAGGSVAISEKRD